MTPPSHVPPGIALDDADASLARLSGRWSLRHAEQLTALLAGLPEGVRRIDATGDATTRQVALIVDFADAAQAPRVAGLFAEGRVETGSTDRLTLPESPIVRSGEAAAVWRLDGKALQRVAVKLGDRDARTGLVPVLSGLAAGDQVLRNPSRTLTPGQGYELKQAGAASAAAASAAK